MVKSILSLVFISLLIPLNLFAAQVTAVADRDQINMGESLKLELRVQGKVNDDPDLTALEKNWEILNLSESTQIKTINGHFSRSQVFSFSLMPKKTGDVEIPSICFDKDCSLPLPIQVTQTTSNSDIDNVLLEVEATPEKVLVGSQILLTVRIMRRVDFIQASLSEPQVEGVTAEIKQLGKDRHYEVRRDGYLFQTIERRYALFPQQVGTLHLSALQLDAKIPVGRSSFDPFSQSVRRVRRYSQPFDIKIEPLPTSLSTDEWLPAHSLTLEDDWQTHPPTLRVGEPVTRTLTVRATGLPAAYLPELKLVLPDGWKSYPDQPSRSDTTSDEGVIGTLQQKIALVPTQPGEANLAAIDLDWYDTTEQQWRRAHVDPLTISVAPAAAVSEPIAPQEQESFSSQEPEAIKDPVPTQTLGSVQEKSVASFWPWLSLFLALGWCGTLLFFGRQKNLSRSSVLKEEKQSQDKREKDALKAIWSATQKNDPKATREALLMWSRYRFPTDEVFDIEQLAKICKAPLANELMTLLEVLYAKKETKSWSGAGLSEALRHYLQQKTKMSATKEVLPLLYPEENPRAKNK
jgi:hypothetical protein